MKRLKLLLILVLNILALNIINECCATSQEDLFVQANEFYKQNKFAQAQELYEKIPDKSSRVYYNLGNCFYKQNKYGHALLNWRKAEHDWGLFNRSELLRNIALVRKVSGAHQEGSKDKGVLAEQNPVQKLVLGVKDLTASMVSLIRSTPLLFLQIIFLVMWFAMFALLRFLYRNKYRITIIGLFVVLVISGSVLAMKYGLNSRHYGVVLNQASLLSGPGPAYQILGSLEQAEEVSVQKQSGDYCKIHVNSQIGWVACKDIGIV